MINGGNLKENGQPTGKGAFPHPPHSSQTTPIGRNPREMRNEIFKKGKYAFKVAPGFEDEKKKLQAFEYQMGYSSWE